jgi:hypothetical protein
MDNYGLQRWVSFYNDSGEVIPSYSLLMLVSDTDVPDTTQNYQKRLKAKKYAVGDDFGVFAINSRMPVQPEAYGSCTFAANGPEWARTNDVIMAESGLGNTDDWIGQEWGPRDGEWEIGPGSGYLLLSHPQQIPNTTTYRVLVIRNANSSAGIRLMKNIEPGPPDPDPLFLGPLTMTGMVTIANCILADANIAGGTDGTDTFEVSGLYLGGNAIPPNGYFWARSGRDRWYAVCGGVTVIQGEMSGGDLSFTNFVSTGFSSNTVLVAVEDACSDSLIDGTDVTAVFDGDKWIVISDCCPPDPD